jgi:hypothetical protein
MEFLGISVLAGIMSEIHWFGCRSTISSFKISESTYLELTWKKEDYTLKAIHFCPSFAV